MMKLTCQSVRVVIFKVLKYWGMSRIHSIELLIRNADVHVNGQSGRHSNINFVCLRYSHESEDTTVELFRFKDLDFGTVSQTIHYMLTCIMFGVGEGI